MKIEFWLSLEEFNYLCFALKAISIFAGLLSKFYFFNFESGECLHVNSVNLNTFFGLSNSLKSSPFVPPFSTLKEKNEKRRNKKLFQTFKNFSKLLSTLTSQFIFNFLAHNKIFKKLNDFEDFFFLEKIGQQENEPKKKITSLSEILAPIFARSFFNFNEKIDKNIPTQNSIIDYPSFLHNLKISVFSYSENEDLLLKSPNFIFFKTNFSE